MCWEERGTKLKPCRRVSNYTPPLIYKFRNMNALNQKFISNILLKSHQAQWQLYITRKKSIICVSSKVSYLIKIQNALVNLFTLFLNNYESLAMKALEHEKVN